MSGLIDEWHEHFGNVCIYNEWKIEIKQALKLMELVEENTDDISNYNSTKEFLQSLLDVSKETEESKHEE